MMSRSDTGGRVICLKTGGKGKIVVIEGVPAAPTNRDRLRGYQRAFAEVPRHPGSRARHRQLSAAGRKARDGHQFLHEHAQIDAVLSANDSAWRLALSRRSGRGPDHHRVGISCGILVRVRQIDRNQRVLTSGTVSTCFEIGCPQRARRSAISRREPFPDKVMLHGRVIDRDPDYQGLKLTPVRPTRPLSDWGDVVQ